jgi:large subunit ribosomal protein L22
MSKTTYQTKVGKSTKTAKAVTTNAPVSLKYSTELANLIKGKYVNKVLELLERVENEEEHLPLRKYNKKVAHRKGEAKNGVKAGRYPKKVVKAWSELIESAKNNADFKGLDTENLVIIHAFASKGISRYSYQAKGRIGGKSRRKNATHIEVIVSEVKK